jgi:hypothetical protein
MLDARTRGQELPTAPGEALGQHNEAMLAARGVAYEQAFSIFLKSLSTGIILVRPKIRLPRRILEHNGHFDIETDDGVADGNQHHGYLAPAMARRGLKRRKRIAAGHQAELEPEGQRGASRPGTSTRVRPVEARHVYQGAIHIELWLTPDQAKQLGGELIAKAAQYNAVETLGA